MKAGWLGLETAEKSYSKLKDRFVPLRKRDNNSTEEYLWRYTKRLNNGENLEPLTQETGDCVSFATAQAGKYLTAVAICEHGENFQFKDWFPPFIYGVSRTAPECGNGELGRSAGSVGSWAVIGLQKHGVLFSDDEGVPAYSGALADRWGYRGVPQEFYDLAKDNPCKSASKITSVDQLREALLNKCPVIIGSQWGFKVVEKDHHLIYVPEGQWGHEMCFIGWHDDPFPGAFRLNSWGRQGIRPSLNGEPDGGAWCTAEQLEREIPQSELFALDCFQGDRTKGRYSFI